MNGRKVSYATIKDVAELAETSVATVSYILSGKSEKEIEEILTDLFGSLDDEYVKAIRDHLNRKNISIENTDQLIDPPPKLTL